MIVDFYKYQGTGNDFILLDNRNGSYSSLNREQVAFLCNRRYGIGADGLMLLQLKEGYDFEMVYFNADGAEGSMCGNGGRCIVMFAKQLGILLQTAHFLATDGPHNAIIIENDWVELKMKNVDQMEQKNDYCVLNTGSPHYIQKVTDVMELDVELLGKQIRYSPEYAAAGINVNFVETLSDGIRMRTYERGVEAETLSCGTGATAAAISIAADVYTPQEIPVLTPGGNLTVKLKKSGVQSFEDIWLCGPATYVYEGTIELKHL